MPITILLDGAIHEEVASTAVTGAGESTYDILGGVYGALHYWEIYESDF